MKNAVFGIVLSMFVLTSACTNQLQQNQATNANPVQNSVAASNNQALVTSSHSTQSTNSIQGKDSNLTVAPSSNSSAPMMTGNATAIDTREFDAKIAQAEKESKQKPKDVAAKKALAEAYATRAFALTEAAQYRSSLGVFSRALKLDSTNEQAQSMHDEIVRIFKSMNREPPKEGEEPPPLPFKKA
jgi:hypothetical protein